MELGTKLKLCVALSVIALIFKIIVTASPGWVVVKRDVMSDPMDGLMPEDDGLHVDDMQEMMKPEEERVSISFGLWYYKVCKCGKGHDDDDSSEENSDEMEENKRHHKHHRRHHGHHCYHRCYRKKRNEFRDKVIDPNVDMPFDEDDNENDIPKEFRQAREFINRAVEMARHGRHELAWYVSTGVVLGIIGMVGAIVYARGGGVGKHSGRLACSTQVLSAFFFWMAIIRVGTYIIQMKKIQEHNVMPDVIPNDVKFGCPWSLFVAAVGASIMGLVSLFHLIMVSRDRKTEVAEYSIKTQDKIPIIAPKGYEQLIVPSMYMTEEAGPLPEKQTLA